MFGWLYCENMSCDLIKDKMSHIEQYKSGILYANLNDKFGNDAIKNGNIFLEGYVLNISELVRDLQC